ncbi:MAG: hypothetical protein LN569_01900 [Rickettsia endosymbiont of Labidopullus appendiculatus]|nr:hypothetical protein [Rickettsia endosymbiont of Labidopullus appendiculatus]
MPNKYSREVEVNFFNDRELALRFKNNAVSSKERFWYLMINNIIYTLESFLSTKNMYSVSITGLYVMIGTIICYNTNKAGDDKEFIERYVCIGIIAWIRTLVYIMLALFIFGALIKGSIFKEMINESNLEIIFNAILFFCYYWRLNSSIRIAAN